MQVSVSARTQPFFVMATATALLTFGLIVFGAVVRVTDSGLGCGSDWPLCNGTIFPPLDNVTAWIEWLHRLFALLIGLFGLGTLATGWRAYRAWNVTALNFALIAAFLFVVQSALGALVVVMELPPTFVTLHLGVSMLLLGALLVASVATRHRPVVQSSTPQAQQAAALVYVNTAFALVIILTGALVRGSGATLACTDYPLCGGEVLPIAQGQLALIHMFHRLAVAAFGVTLLLLLVQVWRAQREKLVRYLVVAAFVAYALQVTVGALYVLSVANAFWSAAHVTMAAATWGILVVLSAIEAFNMGHITLKGAVWQLQSESA